MEETPKKIKLKPVIFTTSRYQVGAPQEVQQMILLKAMQVTSDPNKLREMMGVRSVAEVYRTLDKLSMRKEYHDALARAGISFDFIVKGIRGIAEDGKSDKDRLAALTTLLKSLGLDKYDDDSAAGGSWEDELLKVLDTEKEKKVIEGKKEVVDEGEDYEVKEPEVPASVKALIEEEEELVKGIYE